MRCLIEKNQWFIYLTFLSTMKPDILILIRNKQKAHCSVLINLLTTYTHNPQNLVNVFENTRKHKTPIINFFHFFVHIFYNGKCPTNSFCTSSLTMTYQECNLIFFHKNKCIYFYVFHYLRHRYTRYRNSTLWYCDENCVSAVLSGFTFQAIFSGFFIFYKSKDPFYDIFGVFFRSVVWS